MLVPKPVLGTLRFCTDFRKVNLVANIDSFPIPRIEYCIKRVGNAKYVTKVDLLKGYWQVPLTDRASKISTFVGPDGPFSYTVIPFGMKYSGALFQRLMNFVTQELEGVGVYIDDVLVASVS